MKHKETIDKIFEYLYEDWMDDIDKRNFRDSVFEELNVSEEHLSNLIEEGIRNGYSPDQQIELFLKITKR